MCVFFEETPQKAPSALGNEVTGRLLIQVYLANSYVNTKLLFFNLRLKIVLNS